MFAACLVLVASEFALSHTATDAREEMGSFLRLSGSAYSFGNQFNAF